MKPGKKEYEFCDTIYIKLYKIKHQSWQKSERISFLYRYMGKGLPAEKTERNFREYT